MKAHVSSILVLTIALLDSRAWAGGSGLNTIVVVNPASSNSLQLGNAYCEMRGVPPQNVLRLANWTGGAIQWTRSDFETRLRNPLLAMRANRGLTNQAEYVLLSMDIPYRVYDGTGQNSTTAALFYGFKSDTTPPSGLGASCSLPGNSANSYAFTERPFRDAPPSTAPTNAFLAFMLTDNTLAEAQLVLARGVASDSSFPTQTVYLARTSDPARSVRYVEFDDPYFNVRVRGSYAMARITSDSTSFTNLLGLQTGLATEIFPTNAFVPGAMSDTLTSFAGMIFENKGQTPLLAFLNAGAAASYGTVVEPCNYTEKFPSAYNYFYQSRGFSLAEAYYQSLRNPYQGLLVGEPLSAPFARRGSADWDSLTNDTVLSGEVWLTPTFFAADTNVPLGQVDLFLDGNFIQTLTNVIPAAGNQLSVTLNGFTVHYPVAANETVASVTANLARALDLATNTTRVIAYPAGDRLELQSLDLATPGGNLALSATTTAAGDAPVTTHLTVARPTFLDTTATGSRTLVVSNAPGTNDWLTLEIVKTNGTQVMLSVTNTDGNTSIGTLMQSLLNKVNSTAGLQAADGVLASDYYAYRSIVAAHFVLYPRSAGALPSLIQTILTASPNLVILSGATNWLDENLGNLRPRNHLYVSAGTAILPVAAPLDTTRFPDGFHELIAVAYQGDSVRTQTRAVRSVRFQNTPLTATLATLVGGSNTALEATLQFAVTANAPTGIRAELFTTGGSVGVVSNQAVAYFSVPATNLSVGQHPFYALVTDALGHSYRTQTQWLRIVNDGETPFQLTLGGSPLALSWAAFAGRSYTVLGGTNLALPLPPIATVLASNSTARWELPAPLAPAAGFRVRSGL